MKFQNAWGGNDVYVQKRRHNEKRMNVMQALETEKINEIRREYGVSRTQIYEYLRARRRK